MWPSQLQVAPKDSLSQAGWESDGQAAELGSESHPNTPQFSLL